MNLSTMVLSLELLRALLFYLASAVFSFSLLLFFFLSCVGQCQPFSDFDPDFGCTIRVEGDLVERDGRMFLTKHHILFYSPAHMLRRYQAFMVRNCVLPPLLPSSSYSLVVLLSSSSHLSSSS